MFRKGFDFLSHFKHVGKDSSKQYKSNLAQKEKHLPTIQEIRVRSLGSEDLLEKEMTTHSSILAWKIPWTEKPGRLQSMGSQRVGHAGATLLSAVGGWAYVTQPCVRMMRSVTSER